VKRRVVRCVHQQQGRTAPPQGAKHSPKERQGSPEGTMYYTWNYSWYYNYCTGYYSYYYTWNYWY
jgi:hypothetical protein